mmetsp:Transcript_44746/g.65682  ORF Transcript_44746/g.65682 Transcript_44746/m.65682 type:complete len:107 (+) Transcript_44746:1-321(+)
MSASAHDNADLPGDLEEAEAPFFRYHLRPRKPLQHQIPAEAQGSDPGARAADGGLGMRWKAKFRVICPWMFKGGVFKTMNTINLAIALAGRKGEKNNVLVIDADPK